MYFSFYSLSFPICSIFFFILYFFFNIFQYYQSLLVRFLPYVIIFLNRHIPVSFLIIYIHITFVCLYFSFLNFALHPIFSVSRIYFIHFYISYTFHSFIYLLFISFIYTFNPLPIFSFFLCFFFLFIIHSFYISYVYTFHHSYRLFHTFSHGVIHHLHFCSPSHSYILFHPSFHYVIHHLDFFSPSLPASFLPSLPATPAPRPTHSAVLLQVNSITQPVSQSISPPLSSYLPSVHLLASHLRSNRQRQTDEQREQGGNGSPHPFISLL